ncbi:Mu transposase C-terminal domain-containing protein [Rhodoblastus sp.]|uniref:Mu transposase C-terminal domain-containing protein n=1 Tax=Rhodoblastus sp. TaxID=1962975 RepID=UPI003F94F77A
MLVNPADIPDDLWEMACRREDVLRGLAERFPKGLPRAAVFDACALLGVSRATLFRLVKRFKTQETVSSLLPRKKGRGVGSKNDDPKRDLLIRRTIERVYLTPERATLGRLVNEIRLLCIQESLDPPSWRTVKARLEEFDLRTQALARHDKRAIAATKAVPGQYRASRPLEVIQIDHTRVDVIVVDEETRKPVGRPWITLAVDIFTRMVTGFYLTMDSPSRLSISLCLLHAVYDKTAWLAERAIDGKWPISGLPETIHVDNGADFHSRAFERACRDEGIALIWREPGEPRYGGHIERLIGTQMGAVHLLPGTTFSSIAERGDYDSKQAAVLTLRELERYIGLEIAGRYHQSIHSGLKRPPIAVWTEHEGETPLRMPKDRLRFWVSFLPEEERKLRPDGIHLFGLRYWSSALTADVGRIEKKLLVKYDPRDLARIFVRRPTGNFVEARYADLTLPSITLSEARAARSALNAKGRREVDMQAIVRTAVSQRALVDDARKKTRTARQGGGATSVVPSAAEYGSLRGVDSRIPVEDME